MSQYEWITDEQVADLRAKHGQLFFLEPGKFAGLGVVFRKPNKIEFSDFGSVIKANASLQDLRPRAYDLALKVIVFPSRAAVDAHLQEFDVEERVAMECMRLRQGDELVLAKKQ